MNWRVLKFRLDVVLVLNFLAGAGHDGLKSRLFGGRCEISYVDGRRLGGRTCGSGGGSAWKWW